MILAIDPGTAKIGWATVDNLGKKVDQGILEAEGWDRRLNELVPLTEIRVVVLGDGTNRVNIEQAAARLLPRAEIAVVDEKGSTVDAWHLKRREEAGDNPFRLLGFTIRQLFTPVPVDDYAARILAMRYLRRVV